MHCRYINVGEFDGWLHLKDVDRKTEENVREIFKGAQRCTLPLQKCIGCSKMYCQYKNVLEF